MNEYLKQYIELQKQFRETEGNPDSVRALYTFKEELEQSEDQQAKEVLVDVYDLLDFKKDAYELLCQIGNRSDKKTLKRLGTLKDYGTPPGEKWRHTTMSVPEMADLLGLKSGTAYDLVKRGYFETTLIDRRIRIITSSFEAWYQKQTHYVKISERSNENGIYREA